MAKETGKNSGKSLGWHFCCFPFLFMIINNAANILTHCIFVDFCECLFRTHLCKWNACILSRIWLFVTPWTVAHQTPLSMGFSRQDYWSGLPFPSPISGMARSKCMHLNFWYRHILSKGLYPVHILINSTWKIWFWDKLFNRVSKPSSELFQLKKKSPGLR